MQFIVEWLRRGVCGENMGCAPRACACALMNDAADHIQLLQDEIKKLRAGQEGGNVSEKPLFHLTPREVFDLFNAGCRKGHREAAALGLRDPYALPQRLRKPALIDLMCTHAMHIRYQDGNPVHDRDELRRAIEAMFEGVE